MRAIFEWREEIIVFADEQYAPENVVKNLEDRWEFSEKYRDSHRLLSLYQYSKVEINTYPRFLCDSFLSRADSSESVNLWMKGLEPSIRTYFRETIVGMASKGLEIIITFQNCSMLRDLCLELGLRYIATDIGPLRAPKWLPNALFDTRGINGETSFGAHFDRFRRYYRGSLLSLEEITNFFRLSPIPHTEENDKIALMLQVPDDTNIIAYGNGWTSESMIDHAVAVLTPTDLVVRLHPNYPRLDNRWNLSIESGGFPDELIMRSKKVIAVNSGALMEAILLGKNITCLGDAVYKYFSVALQSFEQIRWTEEDLMRINFLLMGYFIPYSDLCNRDYISERVRLDDPIDYFQFNKGRWVDYRKTFGAPSSVSYRREATIATGISDRSVVDSEQILRELPLLLIHARDQALANHIAHVLASHSGVAPTSFEQGRLRPAAMDQLTVLTHRSALTAPLDLERIWPAAAHRPMLDPDLVHASRAQNLGKAIGERNRLRILIVQDGMPADDPLLAAKDYAPPHSIIVQRAQDIRSYPAEFYHGLAGFAWLQTDAEWQARVVTLAAQPC
jgi:hypothetical protein